MALNATTKLLLTGASGFLLALLCVATLVPLFASPLEDQRNAFISPPDAAERVRALPEALAHPSRRRALAATEALAVTAAAVVAPDAVPQSSTATDLAIAHEDQLVARIQQLLEDVIPRRINHTLGASVASTLKQLEDARRDLDAKAGTMAEAAARVHDDVAELLRHLDQLAAASAAVKATSAGVAADVETSGERADEKGAAASTANSVQGASDSDADARNPSDADTDSPGTDGPSSVVDASSQGVDQSAQPGSPSAHQPHKDSAGSSTIAILPHHVSQFDFTKNVNVTQGHPPGRLQTSGGGIRALGFDDSGSCISVAEGRATLERCSTQTFRLTADSELRTGALCLDAKDTVAGGAVAVAACDGSASQKWDYTATTWTPSPGAYLRSQALPALCVEPERRDNTTLLLLKACSGQCRQLFRVDTDERPEASRKTVSWDEIADEQKRMREQGPTIACWILTYPGVHTTKARAVWRTWGQKCTYMVFVSSAPDDELPVVAVDLRGHEEGRDVLSFKSRTGWLYMYDTFLDKVDWHFKADDDTYVVMSNLKVGPRFQGALTVCRGGHHCPALCCPCTHPFSFSPSTPSRRSCPPSIRKSPSFSGESFIIRQRRGFLAARVLSLAMRASACWAKVRWHACSITTTDACYLRLMHRCAPLQLKRLATRTSGMALVRTMTPRHGEPGSEAAPLDCASTRSHDPCRQILQTARTAASQRPCCASAPRWSIH